MDGHGMTMEERLRELIGQRRIVGGSIESEVELACWKWLRMLAVLTLLEGRKLRDLARELGVRWEDLALCLTEIAEREWGAVVAARGAALDCFEVLDDAS